ncbi:Nif3-like dinuclear metal center hexameric protein [Actinotalea sp. M2MS4P-6]|uniref:Nif3-like dinuclear metal center hexameric protein n=1 Tax=Actinotalea sp. M2MS4P-6 TaxID=2983762 RepID=UPI0021E50119|nr:Nif3-like dinuclear metal center hexameric protein [Actinotalea sp. M2MS4P-6]MCV2393812.1 Nif3-like dinuclear metal center hexameric protein [Actinotalea sp. M2MS4P-6]
MSPTLADVVGLLESWFPPATAESWDAPGTVCGDPSAPVRKVMLAVDPTAAVVEEALDWGADLLFTHHPLFLRPVHSVAATTYKGALVHRLVRGGCALHAAHTNADAAEGGVADALADLMGLVGTRPLVPLPGAAVDKIVVFVPVSHSEAVLDAMAAAGAGNQGAYSRAAFRVEGTGTFLPGADARPAIGTPGTIESVAEHRLEMIAPRSARAAVLRAMLAAHPYEEVAFDVIELAVPPAGIGTGRVGELAGPTTLRAFAQKVVDGLPHTEHGVRVAGDPDATVRTVAVVGGAGDSLFDAVRASGADVYVTADLRHHPASELRERAALEAGSSDPATGTPYLVDVSHAASEWPWLTGTASRLEAAVTERWGTTVETRVSTLRTDPWTFRLDPSGEPQ